MMMMRTTKMMILITMKMMMKMISMKKMNPIDQNHKEKIRKVIKNPRDHLDIEK